MSSADFFTNITMSGTQEEILSMLKVILLYGARLKSGIYFMSVKIGNIDFFSDFHSEQKITMFIQEIADGLASQTFQASDTKAMEIVKIMKNSPGKLEAEAWGPFGSFFTIDQVEIFQDLAKAAPGAQFDGGISGDAGYAYQWISADLKNRRLDMEYSIQNEDALPSSYSEYLQDQLPIEKFCQLFKVEPSKEMADNYEDLINALASYYNFPQLDFDQFTELLSNYCASSSMDQETFDQIISQLDIMDSTDYLSQHIDQLRQTKTWSYDLTSNTLRLIDSTN